VTNESELTILSLLVGIVGIVLAIVFYIRSRRVKQPLYTIRSVNLLRAPKLEVLDIRYANEPIVSLTATKIAFWNGGRETITRDDIAAADPLEVTMQRGVKALDAQILHCINPANRFETSVRPDASGALMAFDFLDRGEGAVVQLLHTGSSSDDIKIRGTIKGAGRPRQRHTLRFRIVAVDLPVAIGFLAGILGSLMIFLGRNQAHKIPLFPFAPPSLQIRADVLIVGNLLALLALWSVARVLYRLGRPSKGLESFFDEDVDLGEREVAREHNQKT